MSPSARRIRKSVHSPEQQLLRELLVAARNKAGLTQQKLAKRLGKHQSFVAKYEGGERRLDVHSVRLYSIRRTAPLRSSRVRAGR